MLNFSTYGMAGIGIAAAIGFVFALSYLTNTPAITDGVEVQDMTQEQERKESESAPLSSQQEQQGRTEFTIRDNSVACETEECLSFYIWGIVRDISSDSLTLVQSNQTGSESNNSITVTPVEGPRLLWCAGDDSECDIVTYDKIPSGTLACALARLNPDGSFSIDTIFFNTGCTTRIPQNSNN